MMAAVGMDVAPVERAAARVVATSDLVTFARKVVEKVVLVAVEVMDLVRALGKGAAMAEATMEGVPSSVVAVEPMLGKLL